MIASTLISVLVVSLIGGGLAAVLVVAEYYLANYGPCKITINDDKELTIQGGKELLGTLASEKLFIPSACGGRGTCGLCKLKVLEGAGPLLPTEEPFLDKAERESNVRMACQVKVRNDYQPFLLDKPLREWGQLRNISLKARTLAPLCFALHLPERLNPASGPMIHITP